MYGDLIKGFITKGEGVKVHRADCPNIQSENRVIDVQWDDGADQERTYSTDLVVMANDRNFLLNDIMTCLSQCKAMVESVNATLNRELLTTRITLSIRVKNLDHLLMVMANIRKIESVVLVERAIH